MTVGLHSFDSAPAWYCLRARPRRERLAALFLRERVGIEVFAPFISFRDAAATGVRRISEALFPGYLFARFAYPLQVRHVLAVEHVLGLVHVASEPARVADHVVGFLRENVSRASDPAPELSVGAWARVVAGCFREAHGRILQIDAPQERVRLLLVLLGREVQISLPVAHVLPLSDAAARYPRFLRSGDEAAPAA